MVAHPFSYVKMELTEDQKHRYETVEWLLDRHSNLGTGRTTLMAIAIINIAIKHPGQRIDIFDHVDAIFAQRYMVNVIQNILSENKHPVGNFKIHLSDFSIEFVPSKRKRKK